VSELLKEEIVSNNSNSNKKRNKMKPKNPFESLNCFKNASSSRHENFLFLNFFFLTNHNPEILILTNQDFVDSKRKPKSKN